MSCVSASYLQNLPFTIAGSNMCTQAMNQCENNGLHATNQWLDSAQYDNQVAQSPSGDISFTGACSLLAPNTQFPAWANIQQQDRQQIWNLFVQQYGKYQTNNNSFPTNSNPTFTRPNGSSVWQVGGFGNNDPNNAQDPSPWWTWWWVWLLIVLAIIILVIIVCACIKKHHHQEEENVSSFMEDILEQF